VKEERSQKITFSLFDFFFLAHFVRNQEINSKSTNHESTFILPLLIAFPKIFVFSGCFVAIDPAFIPKEINNRYSDKRYVNPKF